MWNGERLLLLLLLLLVLYCVCCLLSFPGCWLHFVVESSVCRVLVNDRRLHHQLIDGDESRQNETSRLLFFFPTTFRAFTFYFSVCFLFSSSTQKNTTFHNTRNVKEGDCLAAIISDLVWMYSFITCSYKWGLTFLWHRRHISNKTFGKRIRRGFFLKNGATI